MNQIEVFKKECEDRVRSYAENKGLQNAAHEFLKESVEPQYSYNFTWMGRPIIQYPQDMIAMQEVLWKVQPDLIIETGIAHGGSLIFYASLLELIGKGGSIVGIDIDIREHNKKEIEAHPMFKHISLIEGSSIDAAIVEQVKEAAQGKEKIVVVLDSNHTHKHVLEELRLYAPFVSKESYLVVFDTLIEDMPADFYPDRSWTVGDNPKTAVYKFLEDNKNFVIDKDIINKILISVAPDGYLQRIS